jgi:UDP-xylose:glucoside alpha-1,3-xylosyltransferase
MKTKRKYTFFVILGTGAIIFQLSNLNQVINQSEKNNLNAETEKKLDDQIIVHQENLLLDSLDLLKNDENVIKEEEEIIIAMAVCGVKRINESIVMIKSAILFSKIRLRFVIFVDEIANETLSNELQQKIKIKAASSRHIFEIRKMQFPTEHGIDWKSIFRPCSCQRLFLPVSL